MKRVLLFLTTIFVIQLTFVHSILGKHDKNPRIFSYKTLKRAILISLNADFINDKKCEAIATDGLIILLAEIDSDEARNLLLEMVEVYIGSATGEALTYAIVKQGKAIRGGLELLLSKPVECAFLKEDIPDKEINKKIRCRTRQERDRKIRWLLKLIDEGKIVEYVF